MTFPKNQLTKVQKRMKVLAWGENLFRKKNLRDEEKKGC